MEASKLLTELIQGRELAKQLQNHLDPSTPNETRKFLIQKILSTYNNLLQMANPPCKSSFQMNPNSHQISFHGGATTPVSSCSAPPCLDLDNRGHSPSKRRKILPKWVEAVKVRAEEGEERNLSDGYSWRKYGQKAILGAKFPRSYYRCTHRHTRGCSSTKQVQKSSDDPTFFQVIYRGHHTCSPQSVLIDQPSTDPNLPASGSVHPSAHQEAHMSPQQEIIQNHHTLGNGVLPELKGGTFSVSPPTSGSSDLLVGNAGGNDMWMPELGLNHEHDVSSPDSPFRGFEFTLKEFGIELNFPFNEPEFML